MGIDVVSVISWMQWVFKRLPGVANPNVSHALNSCCLSAHIFMDTPCQDESCVQ